MSARRSRWADDLGTTVDIAGADSTSAGLLELVANQTTAGATLSGITIGTIKSVDPESCEPCVEFQGDRCANGVRARSTVRVRPSDTGRQVAIAFERGDAERPVVIGLIQPHAHRQTPSRADAPGDVEVDGERLVISAQKEIVIRCGKATIILTRAGKILIRGAYLLNRSSGVNRIKGGSVRIN
jgi:hypothetical protein